jgi:hypothetical protein
LCLPLPNERNVDAHSKYHSAPRSQDWRFRETLLRDALIRLGVQLRHRVGHGSDFVIAEFFDPNDERLLQVKYIFSIETLAKLMTDGG